MLYDEFGDWDDFENIDIYNDNVDDEDECIDYFDEDVTIDIPNEDEDIEITDDSDDESSNDNFDASDEDGWADMFPNADTSDEFDEECHGFGTHYSEC